MTHYIPEPQPQDDSGHRQNLQQLEEFCIRAAQSIASDVERGGLAEVNSFLKQHGLEVRRV